VKIFASDSIVFKLPKGITVRDASVKGLSAIGQFENERFEIVLTSEDGSLVNYYFTKNNLNYWNNYYLIKY
jgi:hypothetical protein